MSYNYNFIEHTADIAVEVKADSLSEFFMASALAWKDAVIDGSVKSNDQKELKLRESSIENLLVQFLNDLNFLLNTKKWIFSNLKEIDIKEYNDEFFLNTLLTGESFDERKHNLKEEIKSVTYHQMDIKKENGKYFTRIVFDI